MFSRYCSNYFTIYHSHVLFCITCLQYKIYSFANVFFLHTSKPCYFSVFIAVFILTFVKIHMLFLGCYLLKNRILSLSIVILFVIAPNIFTRWLLFIHINLGLYLATLYVSNLLHNAFLIFMFQFIPTRCFIKMRKFLHLLYRVY